MCWILERVSREPAVTNCNYLECRQVSLNYSTMEMTNGFLMVLYVIRIIRDVLMLIALYIYRERRTSRFQ